MNFDSKEEKEFHEWLLEAHREEFIKDWIYQPESYEIVPRATRIEEKQLKTKTKLVEKFLLHPLSYTADWIIYPTNKFEKLDHGLYKENNQDFYVIDVKGEYNRKNTHRIFSMHQKLVYHKYKEYINLVVPEKFFNKTWVPQSVAFMKNRKHPTIRKPYRNAKFISEVIDA